MRFISRGAFLALMALVLSAVAASAASAALPEFQKEGKPLTEAVKVTAKAHKSLWETASVGGAGTSESGSFTGEIKASGEIAHVTITFAGNENGYPCSNNLKSGEGWELVTSELTGSLGYTNKASKLVGALFEPVAQPFATCKYKTIKGDLDGSLLGSITPVNTASTSFTITYSQSKGVQSLTHFEGSEVLHHLEGIDLGDAEEGVGLSGTFTLTTSKAIEIKA
jgi:hypothetical protein